MSDDDIKQSVELMLSKGLGRFPISDGEGHTQGYIYTSYFAVFIPYILLVRMNED